MKRTLACALAAALLVLAFPVVRGWSRSPAAFPHAAHLAADLTCEACHKQVAESQDLKTEYGFAEAPCADCHAEEDLSKWGYAEAPEREEEGVPDFSHREHLAMGETCGDCHGAILDPTLAGTEEGEPGHAVCIECHADIFQTKNCEFCHTGMREDRLSAFDRDPGAMKPMNHHPGFLHDHQFAVRLDGRGCADCHQQEDFCSTCHQGEGVDFLVHPRNWLYDHPLAARKNLPDCSACHDRGTYCTECHLAEGVRPENHGDGQSVVRVAWRQHEHGVQARRDAALCAGCHDADNLFLCVWCHQAPGGRSPHDRDFKSNAGHGYWHDECRTRSGACFDCHQHDQGFCGRCHVTRSCE